MRYLFSTRKARVIGRFWGKYRLKLQSKSLQKLRKSSQQNKLTTIFMDD